VFDDGAADPLAGGLGDDWFWATAGDASGDWLKTQQVN